MKFKAPVSVNVLSPFRNGSTCDRHPCGKMNAMNEALHQTTNTWRFSMIKLCRALLLSSRVALLSSGCASGPQYKEIASSIPTLAAVHGRIYFFRESSIFGATIQPDIKLNGEVVGRSTAGGFFYVDEPEGQYTVSTTTETEKSVSFTLHAGDTKYVRTSVSMGVLIEHVTPTLDDPDTGAQAIGELKYTGTSDGTRDPIKQKKS
ncbi:Putative lipoprotein (modular protein) [Paraburkholderia ribeironis]|uniref:Putative lipoprotein (Modular protein) n=1 Tax=Paraburkholderia ribeironis TaxID=1247936 RepID=A0A1N7RLK6_9BURK|nr:DUF2846 domain-containing protein [Paraburkholderia ribeironis]SIT35577.1 Putative lipoprotein (modular protein) [Paraburkholderia ribeironis]